MRVDTATIDLAFQKCLGAFFENWPVSEHLEMHKLGQKSFDGEGDAQSFVELFRRITHVWKAYRNPPAGTWDADRTFGELRSLPPETRSKRLSVLQESDWRGVQECLVRLRDMKPNKEGPSLVAITKFLHFWNPRLFVIVDREMVQQRVFGHQWLSGQLDSVSAPLEFEGLRRKENAWLTSYLRILAWAGALLRRNPYICVAFERSLRERAMNMAVPCDIATYEATAVEWFLIGLVEIPPSGVSFDSG